MLKILACVGIGLLAAFISYLLGMMIGRDKETEQELTDYGGGTYVLNNITHSNYDSTGGFIVNLIIFSITSMAFLKILFSVKMLSAIGLGVVIMIVSCLLLGVLSNFIVSVGKLGRGLSKDEKTSKAFDIAIILCCLMTGAMIAAIFFQLNLF